jgi:hypothetical protein
MCGGLRLTHFEAKNLFQIFSLDIVTINQLFLVVVNINANRDQQYEDTILNLPLIEGFANFSFKGGAALFGTPLPSFIAYSNSG